MQFINIIKAVMGLLPLIIQFINQLEEAFPESGKGALKLAIIKSTIESVSTITDDLAIPFSKLWDVLQSVIAAIVNLKNGGPKGT